MATRDLARYRSRSGSALSAITLGILIAVIICVVAAARYGDVLDYAGPNLALEPADRLYPSAPSGSVSARDRDLGAGTQGKVEAAAPSSAVTTLSSVADDHRERNRCGTQGHHVVDLETTSATLLHAASGRQFSGSVYVATPQLLKAFGINPASINPRADILTMRVRPRHGVFYAADLWQLLRAERAGRQPLRSRRVVAEARAERVARRRTRIRTRARRTSAWPTPSFSR